MCTFFKRINEQTSKPPELMKDPCRHSSRQPFSDRLAFLTGQRFLTGQPFSDVQINLFLIIYIGSLFSNFSKADYCLVQTPTDLLFSCFNFYQITPSVPSVSNADTSSRRNVILSIFQRLKNIPLTSFANCLRKLELIFESINNFIYQKIKIIYHKYLNSKKAGNNKIIENSNLQR